MKKFLSLLILGSAFVFSSTLLAEDALLKFVPENADFLLCAKINNILKLPFWKELKENNEKLAKAHGKFEEKLKAQGLKSEDIIQDSVIFSLDKDNAGAIFKTGVSEAKLKELLKSNVIDKEGVQFKEETIQGRKVIIFENPDVANTPGMPMAIDKQSVLTYLQKDIVFLTEKDCFAKMLDAMKKSNVTANKKLMDYKKDVPSDSVLWAVFNAPEKTKAAPKAQAQMMGDPMESILGGVVSFAFVGKDKRDITLDLVLDCKNKQSAGMMAMQAQGMIMMGSGAMFQGNPQLGMEVGQSVKISAKDKKLVGKISVSKALQDKLKKYAEEKSKTAAITDAKSPGSDSGAPALGIGAPLAPLSENKKAK